MTISLAVSLSDPCPGISYDVPMVPPAELLRRMAVRRMSGEWLSSQFHSPELPALPALLVQVLSKMTRPDRPGGRCLTERALRR